MLSNDSKHKMKSLRHKKAKTDYLGGIKGMKTNKFTIWIDQIEDGSYRYASWSKSKTINEKPDIIIKNGSVTYEGSARNHWYTFKNADVKYICDINVLGKANDEANYSKIVGKC